MEFLGRLRGLKDTVQVVGTNRIFIVPSIWCLWEIQFRQANLFNYLVFTDFPLTVYLFVSA